MLRFAAPETGALRNRQLKGRSWRAVNRELGLTFLLNSAELTSFHPSLLSSEMIHMLRKHARTGRRTPRIWVFKAMRAAGWDIAPRSRVKRVVWQLWRTRTLSDAVNDECTQPPRGTTSARSPREIKEPLRRSRSGHTQRRSRSRTTTADPGGYGRSSLYGSPRATSTARVSNR